MSAVGLDEEGRGRVSASIITSVFTQNLVVVGGVMVIVLAIGRKIRVFKPGRE
jgi:hypothetical protein